MGGGGRRVGTRGGGERRRERIEGALTLRTESPDSLAQRALFLTHPACGFHNQQKQGMHSNTVRCAGTSVSRGHPLTHAKGTHARDPATSIALRRGRAQLQPSLYGGAGAQLQASLYGGAWTQLQALLHEGAGTQLQESLHEVAGKRGLDCGSQQR